jgi:hypothetical protein
MMGASSAPREPSGDCLEIVRFCWAALWCIGMPSSTEKYEPELVLLELLGRPRPSPGPGLWDDYEKEIEA